jgi:hypothetical protein
MKLFVVVLGCLLVLAFLTWMTASLQQIQVHRDAVKHAQEMVQQRTNAP